MTEREQLEQAIAVLEAQRATLGDAVATPLIAAAREKLAALSEAAHVAPQRKQVTVLFADVSGFTAMSETMDAEEVNDLMNALWVRLDGAITAHGGMIDKHIGDAVMALFGAPTAREDDPEQAIRAALAMQDGLAVFRAAQQIGLAMRVGINTGPCCWARWGRRPSTPLWEMRSTLPAGWSTPRRWEASSSHTLPIATCAASLTSNSHYEVVYSAGSTSDVRNTR